MTEDICGCTNTTSGDPCQNPAGSCPWHDTENPAEGRKTRLEENPEIKDLIVGELQAGATVPEACAEAGLNSTKTYYNWRNRGREENDPPELFLQFLQETTHARRVASKNDRRELKSECKENNDTRTWYKLHHDQYGDTYGKEEAEERATGSERFGVPDELIEQWQQEA